MMQSVQEHGYTKAKAAGIDSIFGTPKQSLVFQLDEILEDSFS